MEASMKDEVLVETKVGEVDFWVITERDNLDCILEQVPSNRSRKTLIPLINKQALPGSLFCSDGWRAYMKLADHLNADDALHYPVNPDTGAHTQIIEGLWGI